MKFNFFAYDEQGKRYAFEQEKRGEHIFLTLKKELFCKAKRIEALGDFTEANIGDEGYYLVSRNRYHYGDVQTFFTPREDVAYTLEEPTMAFCGVKREDGCYLIRAERVYNFSFRIAVKNGRYRLSIVYNFGEIEEGKPVPDFMTDDIRIEIISLGIDADYNTMACTERELRLARNEITTLREKCQREAVEYARKYPLIRIRMGWKPSPAPIAHQTPENEPEMYVACTFQRVCEIADELKRQGVEGAELQLVGWNVSGHDGRYPQIFPADERLGGNQGLKETIDYVKSLGYRISTHTNVMDAYEIADCFDWKQIAVEPNGEYKRNGHYSAGYAYYVCPRFRTESALRMLPALAEYGENGLHYSDVDSIIVPTACYSKEHPCSTKEGIDAVNVSIAYTSRLFGGYSSEGGMDFTMRDLDYGLYITFGDAFGACENPFIDRFLLLWEVVYHGITLYNPTSATINAPIKSLKDRLTLMMRGGKPSFYIYSKFRTGGTTNWMGEDDLICDTDEDMRRTVAHIKEGWQEYAPLADKQFVFMDGYDILQDGLERGRYSDGSEMIGNFSDVERVYEGQVIKPYGYVVRSCSR